MNSTSYAKRTAYKPIDFFFRAVTDVKTKKTEYVDAFQMLNDRFLGRMSVCNYFFIAENSVRINELNVIALDELKNYHLVMRENFAVPSSVTYSLPLTVRFFESDKEMNILLASIKENGYKKNDVVFTFDCNTMLNLDDEAIKRYTRLRKSGFKTCLSGFGEVFNQIDIFAKFKFEYIRTEAAYFDATDGKKKLLAMLVSFCRANKLKLVMEGVDTPPQKTRFTKAGVKLMTGKAVSKLSRYVTNDLLNLPKPAEKQAQALAAELDADLAVIDKKNRAELDAMRRAAEEKAKSDAANGRIMPRAPRPELMKSPYQLRLEQQKLAAKRALEAKKSEPDINLGGETTETAEEVKHDMLMFEGGVQSALSLTFQSHKADVEAAVSGTEDKIRTADADAETGAGVNTDEKAEKIVNAQAADNIIADEPDTKTVKSPDASETGPQHAGTSGTQTGKEEISAPGSETSAQKSFEDYFEGLDGNVDESGFITVTDSDGETFTGRYNEQGQWVDVEGTVYDGYFDENGAWVNFDEFVEEKEGSYNEQGQWVDADGNVYDGYFDADGRWIDYFYETEDGETVSNGYFDEKIKKWVPYGYFNASGEYIEF